MRRLLFLALLVVFFASITLLGCSDGGKDERTVLSTTSEALPGDRRGPDGTDGINYAVDVNALMAAAREDFKKARYEEAVEGLKRLLTVDPQNRLAWEYYRKAVIAFEVDNFLSHIPEDRYKLMPWDFLKARRSGRRFFILDVREPEEFDKGHLKGAINVPFRSVLKHLDLLPDNATTTILIVCRSQHRSNYVMEALRLLGFKNVLNLAGGYRAYREWLSRTGGDVTVHKMPPKKGAQEGVNRKALKSPETGDSTPASAGDDDDEEDFGC